MSEEQLLAGARDGNEAAFEQNLLLVYEVVRSGG